MKNLKRILEHERDEIDHVCQQLATNFDIPARDIIAMGCAKLGINRKQWDQIQSMRIEEGETRP